MSNSKKISIDVEPSFSLSDNSDLLVCPRCGEPLAAYEVGRATIDGEPAHVNCTIDELDEDGMDDYFGCNG